MLHTHSATIPTDASFLLLDNRVCLCQDKASSSHTFSECLCHARECLSEARGALLMRSKGTRHRGMLVLQEGILPAIKGILWWNTDNHIARQRRMLVPDNGVLIPYKEVLLPHRRVCLCQAKECLAHTKQSFLLTQASSCHQ